MTVLLSILFILLVSGLILVTTFRVHTGILSEYELRRRSRQGDSRATVQLRRQSLLADIEGILQAKRYVLMMASFAVAVAAYGWGWASLMILMVILLHPSVSRFGPVVRISRRLYERYEPSLLRYAEAWPLLGRLLKGERASAAKLQVGSREELAHLIDQAGAHLTHEQQTLLLHSLSFDDHTIGEVMTQKGEIDTIDRRELLGPLVLDDLHKTGHSFFPVTDGGIDHVVGVLSIDGFLSLDSKRSVTAEKAMTPHVQRISETMPLRDALQLFLRSHQHLLIVENQEHETVGVVTLYDIVRMLFGR
jgi:CBS domain containing-hemolysin-like protein